MLNEQRMSECGREPEQFGYNDLMLNEFAHSSSTFMICLRFMVEIFKGKKKTENQQNDTDVIVWFRITIAINGCLATVDKNHK